MKKNKDKSKFDFALILIIVVVVIIPFFCAWYYIKISKPTTITYGHETYTYCNNKCDGELKIIEDGTCYCNDGTKYDIE